MEAVRAPQVRLAGELGAQQVAERHRDRALLDGGDRLLLSQLSAQDASDPAQRLQERGDATQVRAGADHDLRAGLLQGADGSPQRPHRLARRHAMRHVVGADHDHGHVDRVAQGALHLDVQVLGLGTGDGLYVELDPPAEVTGEHAGQQSAWCLGRVLDAEPRSPGVAEDGEVQRPDPAARLAVGAAGVGCMLRRHADRVAGKLGLTHDQAAGGDGHADSRTSRVRRFRQDLTEAPAGPRKRDHRPLPRTNARTASRAPLEMCAPCVNAATV
jgi:hypothetical protein